MAEHINGYDLLSSGGHLWLWDGPQRTRKSVGSAGLVGEYSMVTAVGPRPGRIVGKGGAPALLTASGGSRGAADSAINAIENSFALLIATGAESHWEDDQGHSGSGLVLTAYQPAGPRSYGRSGGQWEAWQEYTLSFEEMYGGWFF